MKDDVTTAPPVRTIGGIMKKIEHIPKCQRSGEMNIFYLYMKRKCLFLSKKD